MADPAGVQKTVEIDLQPIGRRVEVETGTSLLAAAQTAAIGVIAICGGMGICGSCRVHAIKGELTPPTLEEEYELGAEGLANQLTEPPSFTLAALAEISSRLHSQNWQGRAVLRRMMRPIMGGNALITVVPPASPLLGFAIDIGTTKLAGYLIDLQTGSMLAKGGAANPQIAFGEDVVSRIAYTN